MEAQADEHIRELADTTSGWGGTTKDSVKRLAKAKEAGVVGSWQTSGQELGLRNGKRTGGGNGVPMKISPVAAVAALLDGKDAYSWGDAVEFTQALSLMTHRCSASASAALAIMHGVHYCLRHDQTDFDLAKFCSQVISCASLGGLVMPETIGDDDITKRLEKLMARDEYDKNRIISEFGGGSCYCYDSIPFTLMFFVNNPGSVEALYDIVNAGGDTDSNGSMLGAMLGALHGPGVFPAHLHDALDAGQKAIVLDVANRFYETFVG
jgi:ADP-ribosylglycohydrolase